MNRKNASSLPKGDHRDPYGYTCYDFVIYFVTVVEVWKIHDEKVLAVVELWLLPGAFVGVQSPWNPSAIVLNQPKLIKQMDQPLVPIGLDTFQHVFECRLIQSAWACYLGFILVELDLDVRPDEIVCVAESVQDNFT